MLGKNKEKEFLKRNFRKSEKINYKWALKTGGLRSLGII